MAEQVDRLKTVIMLEGAAEAIMGLQRLGQAATAAATPLAQLSQASTGQAVANRLLGGSFLTMAGQVGIAVLAFQRINAVVAEGMRTADQYNQSLTRTLLLYRNAGINTSAAAVANFARGRQFALGIPEGQTLDLAGQMAERGFSLRRTQTLLPALQNAELGSAGRVTAQSALEMMLRILERPISMGGRGGGGASRGLLSLATQLGITMKFSGDTEADLDRLTSAINAKFGGVADALANTSSGVHLRYQQALTTALGRLGSLIEVALTPAMRFLTTSLNGTSVAVDAMLHGGGEKTTRFLEGFGAGQGLIGIFLHALGEQRKNEETLRSHNVNERQLDELHRIAQNTDRMAQAIAITVFGNMNNFTRGAGAWRNLNQAIQGRG